MQIIVCKDRNWRIDCGDLPANFQVHELSEADCQRTDIKQRLGKAQLEIQMLVEDKELLDQVAYQASVEIRRLRALLQGHF